MQEPAKQTGCQGNASSDLHSECADVKIYWHFHLKSSE